MTCPRKFHVIGWHPFSLWEWWLSFERKKIRATSTTLHCMKDRVPTHPQSPEIHTINEVFCTVTIIFKSYWSPIFPTWGCISVATDISYRIDEACQGSLLPIQIKKDKGNKNLIPLTSESSISFYMDNIFHHQTLQ